TQIPRAVANSVDVQRIVSPRKERSHQRKKEGRLFFVSETNIANHLNSVDLKILAARKVCMQSFVEFDKQGQRIKSYHRQEFRSESVWSPCMYGVLCSGGSTCGPVVCSATEV